MFVPSSRLEVDVGNTRIKWRYGNAGHWCARGVLVSDELLALTPLAIQYQVEIVAIASVANLDLLGQLEQDLAQCGISFWRAQTQQEAAGVRNAYQQWQRLGVDRWLALLAAKRAYPQRDVAILQAGSAVTLDLLRQDGAHLGGYIFPGRQMRRRALLGNTHQIHMLQDRQPELMPGVVTEACVLNAEMVLELGMLNQVEQVLLQQLSNPLWIFAGGDGQSLLEFYRQQRQPRLETSWHDELVLDGLMVQWGEEQ